MSREFYLTLSSNSDPEDEMSGTMTVLHKFLHQWFGNMVTTPWWDYVWLNEGMCNYLNYYIMNTVSLHEVLPSTSAHDCCKKNLKLISATTTVIYSLVISKFERSTAKRSPSRC